MSPGKWRFTAVGGEEPLDDAAVAAAVAAGELPYGIGADCPTRVGGATDPNGSDLLDHASPYNSQGVG